MAPFREFVDGPGRLARDLVEREELERRTPKCHVWLAFPATELHAMMSVLVEGPEPLGSMHSDTLAFTGALSATPSKNLLGGVLRRAGSADPTGSILIERGAGILFDWDGVEGLAIDALEASCQGWVLVGDDQLGRPWTFTFEAAFPPTWPF